MSKLIHIFIALALLLAAGVSCSSYAAAASDPDSISVATTGTNQPVPTSAECPFHCQHFHLAISTSVAAQPIRDDVSGHAERKLSPESRFITPSGRPPNS